MQSMRLGAMKDSDGKFLQLNEEERNVFFVLNLFSHLINKEKCNFNVMYVPFKLPHVTRQIHEIFIITRR